METRPADPKHGDFARGGETLPRNERLGSFADGDETEPHDECPRSFAEGLKTKPRERVAGSRRHGHRRWARALDEAGPSTPQHLHFVNPLDSPSTPPALPACP